MKKYAAFATGFALIFALLFLHQCSRTSDSNLAKQANESRYISKLAIADKEIALNHSFILRLHDERREDSIRGAKKEAAHLSDLNAFKRRERRQRPDTVKLTMVDTVYLVYDTMVSDLKNQRDSLKLSYQTEIAAMEANFQTMKGKFELANLERDSLKNLKPDSNWGLGATGGIGAVVSNGTIHTGPGALLGISYRIPIGKISLRKLFRRKIIN